MELFAGEKRIFLGEEELLAVSPYNDGLWKTERFFISCLTTFQVQLKRDQSLHTYNMPRHSASSLVITEARFSFLDTENKINTQEEMCEGVLLGRKAINGVN